MRVYLRAGVAVWVGICAGACESGSKGWHM